MTENACDRFAEDLAFTHASIEVAPQQDGTFMVICLDHPMMQSGKPSLGLSATCIFIFKEDGSYERLRH